MKTPARATAFAQSRGEASRPGVASVGLSRGMIHQVSSAVKLSARPLVVQASLMLPAFLLAETALSYLGVGVQEPEASWGLMLARASDLAQLSRHPFLLLSPALAIFLFVLGVRLISDGLRGDSRGA
jgi:ABC-type dipeptide/oligopeptide/nickel transport system permease subunit